MAEWQPKTHGFESGGCGERSFNKTREPHVMDFHEWRSGLLAILAKQNIPVQQLPDGTIIAKFVTICKEMNPAIQQENYQIYLDKIFGNDLPFEEAAGLA